MEVETTQSSKNLVQIKPVEVPNSVTSRPGNNSSCHKRNFEGKGECEIDQVYEELYFTRESNLSEGKIGPIKRKFFIFFFLFFISHYSIL
jgi:hypothetical protein